MLDKVKNFYLELENWLIQKIDANVIEAEEYEKFLREDCPVEYALYVFMRDYFHY
jgi:hypothetical protein